MMSFFFFFSSRRRHTRSLCDWSSDVCSSDLAADLELGRRIAQQLAHELAVGPSPGRRIENDHMQPTKAVPHPVARDGHGIGEPHALLRVLAADQLHACPFAEIDCWNGYHWRTRSRKARTNRKPGSELFSGWNCTPTVLPARTTAGNRSSSCALHARTTDSSLGRHT